MACECQQPQQLIDFTLWEETDYDSFRKSFLMRRQVLKFPASSVTEGVS